MMKRLAVFLFLAASMAQAQTCTTATCTAAGVSQSQFLAALPSSGNTNPTVVVNIPAGSATWTTNFTYTVPAAVTSLTIQGATVVTCSGTPGTSGYSCSSADNTIINDDVTNSNTPLWSMNIGNATTLFRITGITLKPLNSSVTAKSQGMVQFTGNTTAFRWDHSDIQVTNSDNAGPEFDGQIEGVIDHNAFNCGTNASYTNCIRFYNDLLDNVGLGDGGWMAATQWGSQHALFFESNYVFGGFSTDCGTAGREVLRYNTMSNMQNASGALHSVKDPGGPERGCRSEEFYHNYLTGATPATVYAATGGEGSSLIEWGNTLAQVSVSYFYAGGLWRSEVVQTPNEPSGKTPPAGWAMCGTAMGYPSGSPATSAWDANSSSSTGYPCLDGLGRGQQQIAMNGANFPSRALTTTSAPGWPKQYLEPIYFWMNTVPSGLGGEVALVDASSTVDKDVYFDCNSYNSACSTFTGTHGTGYGLLASRPSTCAPGPGGTYGSSPTGSYGVAYWATDANSGNGELYVCTSTNTWTAIYQPYTYPHPLANGGVTSTSTALSASNLAPVAGTSITLTAAVTPSSGPTGTVTFYDGGVSIGTSTLPTLTHTVTGITAGTHTYTATYGGDANYSSSTSSPVTVTASSPPPTTYPLAVTLAGAGGGTVTSSPAGINCGSTCSFNFTSGTLVTLAATPNGSSTFTGWSGACSGTSTCNVAVNSSVAVTATFAAVAPPSVTVSFTPGAGTYSAPVNVAMSSTNPLIFYTADGSAPNVASASYSAPVTVSQPTMLNAISAAGGSVRRNTQALPMTCSSAGWKFCTVTPSSTNGTPTSCNSKVCGGGIGTAQPSTWTATYGTQESISITGTSGAPQILSTLGGSGDDSATEETMDKWVKSVNAGGHIQNHEMDTWHNDGTHNRLHMGGLQCNQQAGKLQWQYDNEQGSWQNTGITDSCPLSTTLWTHVIWHIHWIIGDTGCGGLGCTYYDYLGVCQSTSPQVPCTINYHQLNETLESDDPGWSAGCADQDQVDLNPGGTPSSPFVGGILIQANNVTCAQGVSAATSASYSFTTLQPIINFGGAIQLSGQIQLQ